MALSLKHCPVPNGNPGPVQPAHVAPEGLLHGVKWRGDSSVNPDKCSVFNRLCKISRIWEWG